MNNKRIGYVSALIFGVIFVLGTITYIGRGNQLQVVQDQASKFQTEVDNLKRQLEEKERQLEEAKEAIASLEAKNDSLKKSLADKGPCLKIEGIRAVIDPGTMIWHDLYFENASDSDLSEVRATVTIVGERGKQESKTIYWATFPRGQKMRVEFPVNDATRGPQKFSLVALCNEGCINAYWTVN